MWLPLLRSNSGWCPRGPPRRLRLMRHRRSGGRTRSPSRTPHHVLVATYNDSLGGRSIPVGRRANTSLDDVSGVDLDGSELWASFARPRRTSRPAASVTAKRLRWNREVADGSYNGDMRPVQSR